MTYFQTMNPTNKKILKITSFGFLMFLVSCVKAPNVCFTNNIGLKTTTTSSHVNIPIDFQVLCERDANKYEWDFGDTTAIQEGVSTFHTYTKPGVYTISLKGTVTHRNEKRNKSTTVTQKFTIEP